MHVIEEDVAHIVECSSACCLLPVILTWGEKKEIWTGVPENIWCTVAATQTQPSEAHSQLSSYFHPPLPCLSLYLAVSFTETLQLLITSSDSERDFGFRPNLVHEQWARVETLRHNKVASIDPAFLGCMHIFVIFSLCECVLVERHRNKYRAQLKVDPYWW